MDVMVELPGRQAPLVLEFDWEMDELEEFVDEKAKEEELDDSQVLQALNTHFVSINRWDGSASIRMSPLWTRWRSLEVQPPVNRCMSLFSGQTTGSMHDDGSWHPLMEIQIPFFFGRMG